MHLEVIRNFKKKHPQARLFLVLNDELKNSAQLFQREFEKIFYFPRAEIFSLANNVDLHILEPHQSIKNFIKIINSFNIHLTVNLTHTKLSGILLSQIKCDDKKGLLFDGQEWRLRGNFWLRYLNEHFASGFNSEYHYIEVLNRFLDLDSNRPQSVLFSEASEIWLNPCSADEKKMWSWESWIHLDKSLSKEYKVRILSGPQDLNNLKVIFSESQVQLATWEWLTSNYKTAKLLITVDTSVLHYLDLFRVKSVVLGLGSSHIIKTGSWLSDSIHETTSVPCYPCFHKLPCSQNQKICSLNLNSDYLLNVINSQLQITKKGLEKVWKENLNPNLI